MTIRTRPEGGDGGASGIRVGRGCRTESSELGAPNYVLIELSEQACGLRGEGPARSSTMVK